MAWSPPPDKKFRRSRSPLSASSGSSVRESNEAHLAFQSRLLFYDEMERRFTPCQVLVDGNNEMPSHVWYQRKEERYAVASRMYKFAMETADFTELMEPYTRKWRHPKGHNDAYIKLTNYLVDELAKRLYFADQKWLVSAERIPLPDPNAVEDLLQVLRCSYDRAVPGAFLPRVITAFHNLFHSSCGREGLGAIIEMAGKVAFGTDFPYDGTETFLSIGTSPHRKEGLPIQVLARSPAHKTDDLRSKSPQSYDLRSKSPHSECGSSTSSKSDKSTASSSSHMMHCDMVVTSVDTDAWTKILLVTEVKAGCGSFTTSEILQMVRRMIALCMHQTEIFGLLINGGAGRLFRLRHDPIRKRIVCYDMASFEHVFKTSSPDMDCNAAFHAEKFKKFIRDLITVLDYAKQNILNIELQLDPL